VSRPSSEVSILMTANQLQPGSAASYLVSLFSPIPDPRLLIFAICDTGFAFSNHLLARNGENSTMVSIKEKIPVLILLCNTVHQYVQLDGTVVCRTRSMQYGHASEQMVNVKVSLQYDERAADPAILRSCDPVTTCCGLCGTHVMHAVALWPP
jgi:hypothetical protein